MGSPEADSSHREGCGRCSFSTVVDAVNDDDEDGERYDPYQGRYIEVDERDLEIASAPAVYAGRLKTWLNRTAYRLIYGR